MKAEYVAPFVTYLCHEDCKDTGSIFEVRMYVIRICTHTVCYMHLVMKYLCVCVYAM